MTKQIARLLVILVLLQQVTAFSLTLEELQSDPDLTPGRFLGYFSDFQFQLGETVQKPEVFLATKCGDCDDFATLASTVLARRGFSPRLVAVFMEQEVHVVCYITETNSYLDYNNRASRTLVTSDGTLVDIANKVATSFRSRWHSVSEVTYANGLRRFVSTEFR